MILLPSETICEIKEKLTGTRSIIGLAILNATENNTPPEQIITEIREMWQDNPRAINGLLGEELTRKILKLK